MSRTGFSCICFTLVLFSSACGQDLTQDELKSIEEINKGIEQFSIHLLLRTALDNGEENFVESPISVWSMLSVLTEGAQGQTLSELELRLRHPKNDLQKVRDGYRGIAKALLVNTSTVQLETVNSIFLNNKKLINPEYVKLVKDYYLTQISPLNFQDPNSVDFINNKISAATRGKINDIVRKADLVDAQMIITNAVFFKGKWKIPFNSSLTKVEPFYDENNSSVVGTVNMMSRKAPFPYVNMKKLQSHIIELPYGEQNRLSMIVIIPHFGVKLIDLYKKFEKVFIKEIFQEIVEARKYDDEEVEVYLPRFTISTDFVMNTLLNRMGIYDVFDAANCDLGKISDDLYLSRVIHKAKIEVNEEGTTAAAITEGELANRNPSPKFVANKPFMYLIIEKETNVIVFAGVYKKPELV